VEKHRVVQILVNLIRNAKYALDEGAPPVRSLTLRLSVCPGPGVRIVVADNGIGIAPEVMPHIFEHGFTTRVAGHGFGLHGSILAARQIGGKLTVRSEGIRRGTEFTLELPCESGADKKESV
jgi:two-component system, NtrC family, sensor kinase